MKRRQFLAGILATPALTVPVAIAASSDQARGARFGDYSKWPTGYQVVYAGPFHIDTHHERWGKGGQLVESQSVHRSYAIRHFEPKERVSRVSRNGKIVWDRYDESLNEKGFMARVKFRDDIMSVALDDVTECGGRIPEFIFHYA